MQQECGVLASRPQDRQGLQASAQPQPSRQVRRVVGAGLLRAWCCSSKAQPGTTAGALPSCPPKLGGYVLPGFQVGDLSRRLEGKGSAMLAPVSLSKATECWQVFYISQTCTEDLRKGIVEFKQHT